MFKLNLFDTLYFADQPLSMQKKQKQNWSAKLLHSLKKESKQQVSKKLKLLETTRTSNQYHK